MAPLASAALLLAASAVVSAHFTLDYPPTIGFNDDKESIGPCGSFTPDFSKDNVTDFHVGGDNVAINLLHPQGTWLYRATLDQTATGNNWTQLHPETLQTGLGKFCQPAIAVPESWAGKKGVLGIVVDAPDGLLYQCASVNFVAGAATQNQSTCTNSSGVTASFVTDANLAPLAAGNDSAGDASASGTGSSGSTPTTTGTGSTGSSTKNAAPGRVGGSLPLGSVAGVVLAAMFGSAFMML
ncbi:GPI anchored cell wall protein [Sporothrix schenckii 1099-18]|uniref:Copper acquisition factor BIM1-like domain-containing protein n=2 Tax=Sporothrix schenckii TaxID=29908 RepID=U7PUN0_SPOS1|nr:GPI anchored cell wall protein [Sporothrix schenckii 1099-18]ERS98651.1 hypothetical protein HMPREF1624_05438 [Sporothrix schenckii ATCC 58251]KJR89167.1 GPI anchored cell wall protein [Sporothrix schenckii 1099-18]